jgi:hypothetical protein
MAGPEQEGRKEGPEPKHTKVCLTVKALPATEPHKSVIDVQRQHRMPLAAVAWEMGDRHTYDRFES